MNLKAKKIIAREFIILVSLASIIGLTYLGIILRENYLYGRSHYYENEYQKIADTLNDPITDLYIKIYPQLYKNLEFFRVNEGLNVIKTMLYNRKIDTLKPPVYVGRGDDLDDNYVSLNQFREWLYLKCSNRDYQFIKYISLKALGRSRLYEEDNISPFPIIDEKGNIIMYFQYACENKIIPSLEKFNKDNIPAYYQINNNIETLLYKSSRMKEKHRYSEPESWTEQIAIILISIIYPLRFLLLAIIWSIKTIRQ